VRDLDAVGKPIALLSQAPLVLASAGILRNRRLTSWPGVRDDIVNAGATWLNEKVVRDANWLSGRGLQDVALFIKEMIPLFAGEAERRETVRQMHSDPQREEPSETPGQPLRWLSTPSVGAMLGLALLGVGVMAAKQGRRKPIEVEETEPEALKRGARSVPNK